MLKRYPQLQSGFIARAEDAFVKPKEPEKTVISQLLTRPPTHTQDEYFFSKEFDLLYEAYLTDSSKFNDPRKQVELFGVLKKLFGNQGWASFVSLQENNPNLSHLHVQFMAETTLLLVCCQTQRRASLPTWASLLNNSLEPLTGGFRVSQTKVREQTTFAQMFKDVRFLESLDTTLLSWIQNYGLGDLMMTCKVLFGRRTIHATKGRPF